MAGRADGTTDWTIACSTTTTTNNTFRAAHLLRVDDAAVEVERHAAVLVDAGAVEEQHQVAPLSLLRELRQPEAHRRVGAGGGGVRFL